MTPYLIVNPRAGHASAVLTEQARARGIATHVLEPGEDVEARARDAADRGARVLGVAGGDGSLAPAAAVALERGLALVCIPTGTLNHFARDVGLDVMRPIQALDGFAGEDRRVDVGRVGDGIFLNNVSFGLYADMVHDENYRQDKLRVARDGLLAELRVDAEQRELVVPGPHGETFRNVVCLFVSNNPIEFARLATLGERFRLDRGVLQLSLVNNATVTDPGKLLRGGLLGTLDRHQWWDQWTERRCTVGSTKRVVRAGVDGEAVMLGTPVELAVEPLALRLRVPPGTPKQRTGAAIPANADGLRHVWRPMNR